MTNEEAIEILQKIKPIPRRRDGRSTTHILQTIALDMAIKTLEQEPISDKYEYHIDHTDCIWYGSDSGCPATCSQYRDGWNDAMDYIFKDGKGYQPYRRREE